MEPCPRCDRPDCPTLTVRCAQFPGNLPGVCCWACAPFHAAQADCSRHRVDWRTRSLAAEAKLRELAGKVLSLSYRAHAYGCGVTGFEPGHPMRVCTCGADEAKAELARLKDETGDRWQATLASGMVNAYRSVRSDSWAQRLPPAAAKFPELAQEAERAWQFVTGLQAEIARLKDALDRQVALDTPLVNANFQMQDEIDRISLTIAAKDTEIERLRKAWDDPIFDATDGAHPAWWRGHDHGALAAFNEIERLKNAAKSRIKCPEGHTPGA